jgi:type VI secretion system secreted protein Hcp
MAQTVHLTLVIDGNTVEGESTILSMDRRDTIECSSFRCGVARPYDVNTLCITDKQKHESVVIHKRIDKSTPLLIKALCENETVSSAEFRFFRPSPGGSGAEEWFYTVLLEDGSISSVRQLSEDAVMGGNDAPPMMEEVAFVFSSITWTYAIGGATHQDRIVLGGR